jgi:hypothetical protein
LSDQRLRNGAAGEGEDVSEDQRLRPSEGAFLVEGGPVRPLQAPEGGEER